MKTILFPTDYSDVANNALEYAIELAKSLEAKLIIFHAYHRRFLLSSLPLLFADAELEKINEDAIKAHEWIIKKKSNNMVETESVVYKGNTTHGIIETIEAKNIDYIVMGITGSSKGEGVLIGSTTISVIKKTSIPIFVIPRMSKFKKIEKVVFINDYNKAASKAMIAQLREIVAKLNAELTIFGKPQLHGVESYHKERAILEAEFENSVSSGINHSLSFSVSDDLTEEINSFVNFYTSDLLVMAQSYSGIFNQIFNRGDTNKMILHTHLPLLILHEKAINIGNRITSLFL